MRALCTVLMCVTARSHPKISVCLYTLSAFGDLFDGMAARALNQISVFGSVLDMVIDRLS